MPVAQGLLSAWKSWMKVRDDNKKKKKTKNGKSDSKFPVKGQASQIVFFIVNSPPHPASEDGG